MPIETTIDTNECFITHIITVSIRSDEIIKTIQNLYLDSNHDPARPTLWDARQVDTARASFSDIFQMVEHFSDSWSALSGGKTAILVGDSQQMANARLFKTLANAMPRELGNL